MMFSEKIQRKFYNAFINSDPNYKGIFYVCVKTTKTFRHATCTAKKPKFENCDFYQTVEEALRASFKPCGHCKPLLHPDSASDLVQTLVEIVETNPNKKIKDLDFKKLSIDPSTVRRQFKKRFGMTFNQYARAKRMELAMRQIQDGESIINAQLNSGYESSSGFWSAFSKTIGGSGKKINKHLNILKASWVETKLGTIIVIGNETNIYLLEFIDNANLKDIIKKIKIEFNAVIIPGSAACIKLIENHFKEYFDGIVKTFAIPSCIYPVSKTFALRIHKYSMGSNEG